MVSMESHQTCPSLIEAAFELTFSFSLSLSHWVQALVTSNLDYFNWTCWPQPSPSLIYFLDIACGHRGLWDATGSTKPHLISSTLSIWPTLSLWQHFPSTPSQLYLPLSDFVIFPILLTNVLYLNYLSFLPNHPNGNYPSRFTSNHLH